MSVSVSEGNADRLQLVAASDPAYKARLAELKEAQRAATEMRDEAISLHRGVVDMRRDCEQAWREIATAREKLAKAQNEAEKAKAKFEAAYNHIMRIAAEDDPQ